MTRPHSKGPGPGHPEQEAGDPAEDASSAPDAADAETTNDPFEKKPSRHAPFDIGHDRDVPGAPTE